jgi:hypothetical protein
LFGKETWITIYVNADDAHDTVTQRSVTAIILFINNTSMQWHSPSGNELLRQPHMEQS